MGRMSFKDRFSDHAELYARHRPGYPEELFAYLASLAPRCRRAADLATGNGQAALGLARHFGEVVAVDASAAQLAHARPHPHITYRQTAAEATGLPDAWADLITIAQALHWMHFDRLWPEVERVLAPGGVIAAWMYDLARTDPEVDRIVDRFYREVVGPCWDPERRFVDEGYRTVPFPFREIIPPAFELTGTWGLKDLLGYLSTWSASRHYLARKGEDPVDEIRQELAAAWRDPETPRPVRWPLHLRVGRVGHLG